MKKILAILLAAMMLFSVMTVFTSCDDEADTAVRNEDEDKDEDKATEAEESVGSTSVTVDMRTVYEEVNSKVNFDEKISYMIYGDDDPDEMLMMRYGIVDIEAADHIVDYAISMPSDYCNTFAVFVFDEELSADAIAELKDVVMYEYVEARASSLQMYMPEEYAKMSWAVENPDLIWREYDNALALLITGDGEATDAFEAFEEAALK